MTDRIPFIDDEKNALSPFQRLLCGEFDVTVAQGAEEAFAKLASAAPSAVVARDMRMPAMDGGLARVYGVSAYGTELGW